MSRRIAFVAMFILACFSMISYAQTNFTDDQIRSILKEQMELKKIPGIAVGIIDQHGKKIICEGKLDKKKDLEPDSNTLYEIGSITKVFTSLILQEMADRGKLDIHDPISKFLPESVKTPTKDGKEITLLDLSSQISGLPRMPTNFAPADYSNPFADYTPEKLYEFLSSYKLTRGIGEKYEYSNVGVGLLGYILSLVEGTDYETLVHKYVCDPLNMKSTFVSITPEFKKRLATGYNAGGYTVKNWDFSALPGAGALKSSVNDLLIFLEANLGLVKTKLLPAMEKIRQARHDTGVPDLDIAMGWHIWKKFNEKIIWHNGGTAGYRTFIGFNNENKKGVVVLSNSSASVDDIGLHLLDDRYELRYQK